MGLCPDKLECSTQPSLKHVPHGISYTSCTSATMGLWSLGQQPLSHLSPTTPKLCTLKLGHTKMKSCSQQQQQQQLGWKQQCYVKTA
jgi:hypothetical protein